ncbi:MAG TPA: hypothetical protein DDW71_10480 [Lactobacillus sp.]|nr:hypothetical protein [Lactobacillus sp.]
MYIAESGYSRQRTKCKTRPPQIQNWTLDFYIAELGFNEQRAAYKARPPQIQVRDLWGPYLIFHSLNARFRTLF